MHVQLCSILQRYPCWEYASISAPHPHGLVDRVGKENAARIGEQLRGTPYEWMLDDKAESWPEGVQNTCKV